MKPPLKPPDEATPEAARIVSDLMETGVQASSGWMVRQRVLSHSGPEAAPEAT